LLFFFPPRPCIQTIKPSFEFENRSNASDATIKQNFQISVTIYFLLSNMDMLAEVATMGDVDDNFDAKDGGKISKRVPRGPRYTQNEDLIICQ
jgi:hypothetical protein